MAGGESGDAVEDTGADGKDRDRAFLPLHCKALSKLQAKLGTFRAKW